MLEYHQVSLTELRFVIPFDSVCRLELLMMLLMG